MVTVTGGRLPRPSAATTSGGTRNPVAVRPSSWSVVRNLISRSVPVSRPPGDPGRSGVAIRWPLDRLEARRAHAALGLLRLGAEHRPAGVGIRVPPAVDVGRRTLVADAAGRQQIGEASPEPSQEP